MSHMSSTVQIQFQLISVYSDFNAVNFTAVAFTRFLILSHTPNHKHKLNTVEQL